jgi:REP element-mobilizing transposase RayT
MIRKYDYRRTLPHLQKDNRPVFLSFNTIRRWMLPEAARDIVLDCCLFPNGKMARIHVVVVMPEHVHVILTPLPEKNEGPFSLPEITQSIKGVSAHRVNRLLKRQGPVWLEESFDHVLRSSESLEEKVEYIRQNPVRRGLCKAPEEYRWLWVNPEEFDW